VGGIVSELGKGLIRGVLGMNAGVVNINAGVVNGGGGGVPGAGGKPGGPGILPRAGGALLGLGAAGLGAVTVAAIAPVAITELAMALAGGPEGVRRRAEEGRRETNAARAAYRDEVRRRRGMGPANPTGGIPTRLGSEGSTASSRRLMNQPGDPRGEMTAIRGAIKAAETSSARAFQVAERNGARQVAAIDTTRSEVAKMRESLRAAQERAAAALAARMEGMSRATTAAAGSTRSELAGIRAAARDTAAAVRNINFSPRIVVPVTVQNRVTPFAIDRAMDRYYGRGNGSPVRSRRDE